MVISLPAKKLSNARTIVESASHKMSLTLQELQSLTGYLNFAAIVVPLRRTFLRRLYNMQMYIPQRGQLQRKRLSSEGYKDLQWWDNILAMNPERSISHKTRETISLWSDASCTKGLGAFYIDNREAVPLGSNQQASKQVLAQPQPGSAFSISLPRYIYKAREHINTKEMRAVEQALLYWGRKWQGTTVIMHIDNRAVVHALDNKTIRGEPMTVLRRCLLLAAKYDLEIQPQWISTYDNVLADALSRFDHDKITNIAPQLMHPASSLRDCGSLMSNKLDSHL